MFWMFNHDGQASVSSLPPTYTSQLFLHWVVKHIFNTYRQKIPPMEMSQSMKITNFPACGETKDII